MLAAILFACFFEGAGHPPMIFDHPMCPVYDAWPREGELDVPLDAQLWVPGGAAATYTLEATDQIERIAAEPYPACGGVFVTPRRPLLPAQHYELRLGEQHVRMFWTAGQPSQDALANEELDRGARRTLLCALAVLAVGFALSRRARMLPG